MPPCVGTSRPGRWTPWAARTGTSLPGSAGPGPRWCTCPGGSQAGRSTSPASPSVAPKLSQGRLWAPVGWCRRLPQGRSHSRGTPAPRWSHSLPSGHQRGEIQWSPDRPPDLHLLHPRLPPHHTTVVRSPDDDASEKGRKETRKEENRGKKNIEIRTEKGGMKGLRKRSDKIINKSTRKEGANEVKKQREREREQEPKEGRNKGR